MNRGETRPPIAISPGPSRQQPQCAASLVLLKAGNGHTHIFMAHGLGDTAMGLLSLANHMHIGHPIYGLQARGLDGIEEPHERIEDMADYHLEAITKLQPHGPYVLIGYSLGGLVTLEIARRLTQRGETIALLAMLDTYPHKAHLPFGPRIRLISQLAMRRIAALMQERVESGRDMARKRESEAGNPGEQHLAQAQQRVTQAQYRALREYRTRFYDGDVKFVRAATTSYFPSDPIPVWAHLVRSFEIETIPGQHLEMLTTQVQPLSSIVDHYVEKALAS